METQKGPYKDYSPFKGGLYGLQGKARLLRAWSRSDFVTERMQKNFYTLLMDQDVRLVWPLGGVSFCWDYIGVMFI